MEIRVFYVPFGICAAVYSEWHIKQEIRLGTVI
jgi:hypothetical protein